VIQPSIKNVPLAGFFCAGEIGPIAGVNYLHGHTAALALFRPSA
jgi:small ligand-binding sensory domain FIST